MPIFKFTEAIDASTKPLMQFDGVEVKVPDGRTIYAHRQYLNKLFKDSGYKGVKTVHNVYEIVGNTDKMDHLDISDKVIVIEDGGVNFIYLSKASYESISKILNGIARYAPIWRGDLEDYTRFEGIFSVGRQEYVIQIDLVHEWVNLYTARHATDHRLHPTLRSQAQLNEDIAVGAILDNISSDSDPIDVVRGIPKVRVNELIHILQSTGLIKYNGKKKVYVSRTENEEVLSDLIDFLDKINQTKYRMRFTTDAGVGYEPLMAIINRWYAMVVDELAEIPFAISDYLWAASKLAQIFED